ncbi:MAG: tetratricopeptide repeat protein [Nitrospinota bacterium]|nr:tetratricopeptide repeat protein [Nitrospinota bacterium]
MEIAANIIEEHRRIRHGCGYFPLEDWCLLSASGKDLFSYLQTQTTNDTEQLAIGQGQNSAIVDRKAKLIATFSIHKDGEQSVLFLLESCMKEKLHNHLESFLFREDVKIRAENHALIALQGPKCASIMRELCEEGLHLPEKPNDIKRANLDGMEIWVINKTFTGEEGFVIASRGDEREKFLSLLTNLENEDRLSLVGPETREVLRIEAGIPFYDKDYDEKNILPETGLEHSSVSYNKGCYIGQEVIARIKTYGAPNFALMGLIVEGDRLPPIHADIRLGSKKIGIVKSSVHSLSLGKIISLAYIQKDHRSPDIDFEVTIGDTLFKARTSLIPFFQTQTRKDHSRRLLLEALKIYKQEEDLEAPISLLREAIDLDPKHAAAYEALGVFLSKQNKLEEAISVMKRLVEIDPSEIMAHSNLSIYYMQQGRIEDAEKEKGEATALQFEKAIAEKMNQQQKELQEEEVIKERERKIEMFKKVLEIDPVDQIANFGLGSIYLETGNFEEALPPLQTVIDQNRDYSAAYLLLGKTFQSLSRTAEAIETYQNGIAAASKKGDLMPLKDMQTRLNQLLRSAS